MIKGEGRRRGREGRKRKRKKGRGGEEGREGGQRKLEKGNAQELLAVYLGLPHIPSTSVLQMIKPCSHVLGHKPVNEAKPKGVPGNKEKLQQQLVPGNVKR